MKRPFIGAGHPEAAHRKDAFALQLCSPLFCLCLGGEHAAHVSLSWRWQPGSSNQQESDHNGTIQGKPTGNSVAFVSRHGHPMTPRERWLAITIPC
jgi:hypothetical protein